MTKLLRVLQVEDSASDTALISRCLEQAGYEVQSERVDGEAQMQASLARQPWDVVLSDYRMPQFDAPSALRTLKESRRDIPFIVVSGTIGEDIAVEMMKAGAHDYVMKGNLSRLPQAVEREIREALTRKQRAEAEEAIRRSENRYRSILETTVDGFWVIDRDGRLLDANQAYCRLSGYSREELLQMSIRDVEAIESQAETARRIQQIKETGFARFETRHRRKDGCHSEIEISTTYSPAEDCFYVFLRDITQRKQAEGTLRLQGAALAAAANAIVITDRAGTIVWVNPAFTELTQYKFDEAIGKNHRDLIKSSKHSQEFYEDLWRTILAGQIWQGEIINRRKDGSTYPDEMTITPLRNDRGEITHFIAIKQDITDRRRDEEALHLTQASVEQAPFEVLWLDSDGRIVYANELASRTLGYSPAELLLMTIVDLDPDYSLDMYKETWSSLKLTGSLFFETTHRKKDSQQFPVEVTAKHLEFRGREYSCTFSRDITERKEVEEALRQAERQLLLAQKLEAIGQLAAGIAHEINTPVQYIGDNAQFLSSAFQDLLRVVEQCPTAAGDGTADVDVPYLRSEIPNAIGQMQEGVDRVTKIVRAMKRFSHPGPAEKAPIDIHQAIESTVLVSRNEWKYVVDLTTEFDAEMPPVPCIAGEFNQVLLNLIVNATHAIADVVKESGGKGAIRISTRRNGNFAEIRVSDTGGGIPEGIRSKVFDPFFTTKAVGKGTGQGLAIAHSIIVQKHRGTIRFESEIGKGTTFVIQLPLEERTEGKQ